MAFGREDAKLLFRIQTDSAEAESAFDRLSVGGVALGSAIGTAVGSIATEAFQIFTRATVAAGTALFDLAQTTAEYGSEIKDASDKTGLQAESLSALKIAADQSGSSLEELTGPIAKFNKLAGEAAAGSEKAREKLLQFGLDPQDAVNDLDGALAKVFKRIVDAPSQVEQTRLATEAFGRSGANLLPVLKSFDGDLDGLIERAREMGVVFDTQAADAADDFGDSLDSLKATAKGLAMTMGREFLPELTRVFKDLQSFLSENMSTFRTWGTVIKNTIADIRSAFAALSDWFQSTQGQFVIAVLRRLLAEKTGQASEMVFDWFKGQTVPRETGGSMQAQTFDTGGLDAEREAAENAAKRDIGAGIEYWNNYLENLKKLYNTAIDAFRRDFQRTGDADAFTARLGFANEQWQRLVADATGKIEALENKQIAAEQKTSTEIAVIRQERAQKFADLQSVTTKALEDAERLKTNVTEKANDERLKMTEDAMRRELDLYRSRSELAIQQFERDRANGLLGEADYRSQVGLERLSVLEKEKKLLQELLAQKELDADRRAEIMNRIKILDNDLAASMIANALAVQEAAQRTTEAFDQIRQAVGEPGVGVSRNAGEEVPGLFDAWSQSWREFFNMVDEEGPTLATMIGEIGGMLQNTFSQVANALGSVVEQWVLTGETGPAVMKKILAAALASLAAEAAVRAVFELAMGFAALFFNPAEAAAHFTAAALFGSISVGAALAGRAIAGDSFKKQTQTGATGANTQGSRSNSSGGAYSSMSPVTVAMNAQQPAGSGGYVVVKDRSSGGMFDQLFEMSWNNNGAMRRKLIEAFGT